MVSRFSRLRTPLAMRLCSRFHPLSWRFVRYPTTAVAPLRSSSATRAGTSAGSFCRSASSVTITRPRAAWNPAANAAVCPALCAKATTCSSGWSRFSAFSTSSDPSVEPSSTATISYVHFPRAPSARRISSTRSGRLSRSSYTGTTSDTSTGGRPDILQVGRIGMLRGEASDQGVGFGGVFLVSAVDLGEPDPRDDEPVGGGWRHGANQTLQRGGLLLDRDAGARRHLPTRQRASEHPTEREQRAGQRPKEAPRPPQREHEGQELPVEAPLGDQPDKQRRRGNGERRAKNAADHCGGAWRGFLLYGREGIAPPPVGQSDSPRPSA